MSVESYPVRSRYGANYSFDYHAEDGNWYFNISEAISVRFAADPDDSSKLDMVDPDGGPYVCRFTRLDYYHPKLPKKMITSIQYDKEKQKYKLGVS